MILIEHDRKKKIFCGFLKLMISRWHEDKCCHIRMICYLEETEVFIKNDFKNFCVLPETKNNIIY